MSRFVSSEGFLVVIFYNILGKRIFIFFYISFLVFLQNLKRTLYRR